jgi:hypothetical protein
MEGWERQTLETSLKSVVDLICGFATNGGSSPTAAQIFGNCIKSVVRNSAGNYTITLKPEFRYADLVGKSAHLSLLTVANSFAQCGPYDKTVGTLIVTTLTGGAAADIAADANNFVTVRLTARWGGNQDGSVLYDV